MLRARATEFGAWEEFYIEGPGGVDLSQP